MITLEPNEKDLKMRWALRKTVGFLNRDKGTNRRIARIGPDFDDLPRGTIDSYWKILS